MTEPNTLLQPGASIKPKVSEKDVREILSEVYGLKCLSIKELNGYDDNNYHVRVEKTFDNKYVNSINEDGYVLKIINTLESKKPHIYKAQDEILIYLGKRNICCPKPILNKNGQYYIIKSFSSGNHLIKLLEFISGSILCQAPASMDLFYQSGQFLAKLDEALKEFSHSVYDNHKTIWMLESVPQLSQFTYAISDASKKRMIEEIIEQFSKRVLPISSQLDRGMIHGDFNEQNVIVVQNDDGNWFVKGILDFGDSHIGCYIYEVAIAMAYMMIQGKSLDVGSYVLAGYSSVRKISDQEFSLLKICVAARLCQSLVMGAYSILQDPGNSYILTTAKAGWALLEEIWAQPEKELLERWKRVEKEIR